MMHPSPFLTSVKLLSSLSFIAVLSACGGGGGSASNTPEGGVAGEAQGNYSGNFTSSSFPNGKFSTMILDNDEYWTLYGTSGSNGDLLVSGLIQGQGSSNKGTFTSSNLKEYFLSATGPTSRSGTLNAVYQAGATFNGTVTENSLSTSFSGTAPTSGSTNYNYNTGAKLSDISGPWSGSNLYGVASNYTVSAGGTFSGVNSQGCGFSGNVTPRSSGKNVFDITLSIASAANCGSSAGITGRGIGVTSILTNGQRQFIIAMVTSDRSLGSVIFARR